VDDLALARAIHVLAVLHWMGGVAFVTMVVLPVGASVADPSRRLAFFEAVERRFSAQVRVSVPLAGLSGAWMAERMGLWVRFLDPSAWWLAAMAVVWLLFMAILFVVEPFVLRGSVRHRILSDVDRGLRLVQRAHWGLLAAGSVAAAGGVLGAHGYLGR
jgi:uncharacterized membrane protein